MIDKLSEIKTLETKLVKLRLETRHIDFIKDYDRSKYYSQSHKTQDEVQDSVIKFLERQEKQIKNADLINELVKNMDGLNERDFEKTNSGSIRIYSAIRTAIVNLTKKKIVSIPLRGHIILTKKLNQEKKP